MKYSKRLLYSILVLMLIISLLPLAVFAQSYGIIGSVLTTDIRAYINGYEIPAYNVNGNMVIVGSDLRNYGFDVVYDNNSRTSSVSHNDNGTWEPLAVTSDNYGIVGEKVMDVYDTDITVLLNGIPVTSYNVDGRMAFKFSELKIYGNYYYDNVTRTTNLWISSDVDVPTDIQNNAKDTINVTDTDIIIQDRTTINVDVYCDYDKYPDGLSLTTDWDNDIIDAEWGEWDEWRIPLTIIPKENGVTTMTISVVGNPNDYQKIYVAVTGHETVKVDINHTSIVDEDDFISPVDISSIRIEGVGDEFEYWWSARIHNTSKIESAEYKIEETTNNNIKITIDVIASLIDVTGGANSIQIGYELFDEDGICVKSSHVYMKASHLYQKYANSVILYNFKPGNYVLKFKDYIA